MRPRWRARGLLGNMLDMSQALPHTDPFEILRLLENLLRYGVVEEVKHEKHARCRVRTGELLTDWLPWSTLRAGDDVTWWPPSVGERVMILSPGGELRNGTVFPAAYCEDIPQNADSADIHRTTYADGTIIEYHRGKQRLTVQCVGDVYIMASKASVRCSGDAEVRTGGYAQVVAKGEALVKSDTRATLRGPSGSISV